jgi:hypothetical protein
MRALAVCTSARREELKGAEIVRDSLAETDLDALLHELSQ